MSLEFCQTAMLFSLFALTKLIFTLAIALTTRIRRYFMAEQNSRKLSVHGDRFALYARNVNVFGCLKIAHWHVLSIDPVIHRYVSLHIIQDMTLVTFDVYIIICRHSQYSFGTLFLFSCKTTCLSRHVTKPTRG